jgi:HCOMODA/2-hydroxy-3-carboxy-muconic semialdehyde decarboxylase
MAPALVTAADIVELNLDGNATQPNTPGSYLERFIHSEIYRARPDVVAVVHSHSPGIIPFGVVPGAGLKPVSHMGGYLGDGVPVYEIRDTGGPATDMLVRTPSSAARSRKRSVAASCMRGHGATMVGTASVRQAVYRAVYAEKNARLQMEALRLGEPIYLTAEEARGAAAANDANLDRAWQLWKREVRKE